MALNLNDLRTPGVYIDEVSLLPPSVAGVQTGIPAFVGYTQKHLRNGDSLKLRPTRITSMREYELWFGGPKAEGDSLSVIIYEAFVKRTKQDGTTEDILVDQYFKADLTKNVGNPPATVPKPSAHNMFYALQLYFANGCGPCYIVSVGEYPAEDGVLAEALIKGLDELKNEDEPTLLVFPEAIHLPDGGTTAAPVPGNVGVYNAALLQAAELKDRFVIMDIKMSTGTDPVKAFRNASLDVTNLKYGAVYYPYLESTIDFHYGNPDTSAVKIKYIKITDGEAAEPADGYTLKSGVKVNDMKELKTNNSSLHEKAKVALTNLPIVLPASAAMAGIFARVDRERGVWKAPANVSVAAITGPSKKISDRDQETLNVDETAGKSVNAIRDLTGRGTLVWGARTLAGNDNEWRYISVRRFFNFVEESVKKSTMQFVFEPNDENTWVKVRGMIENFLTLQWRQGALQGAKPEQAFYVRVGLGTTMTGVDILEGRMIVEIGMAAVRPAEFIILRFSHKMAEA